MARIVVLQFEDNSDADEFIKEHDELMYYPEGSMGGVSNDAVMIYAGEVVGVFAMPTQFCANSGSGGCSTNKRIRAWSRGKKFGWWVCSICKKPSNFVPPERRERPELWRRVISQGVNLLFAPEDQSPESVHDEGWGAYREGTYR